MSVDIKRIHSLIESVVDEVNTNLEAEKKPGGPAPWWLPYQIKYGLVVVPRDIPKDQVKIDTTGDTDSHWIMQWVNKKGKRVYSYSKGYWERSHAAKYARTSKMPADLADRFKIVIDKVLLKPQADDFTKQAAAINGIIAHTGLRIGSPMGTAETGNRGIMTLSPENVTVNGKTVNLQFIGKSTKENVGSFTDGPLADYLQNRIVARKGQNFLFDVPRHVIDNFYKNVLKMGKFKIKDLRTHNAAIIAQQALDSDSLPPPPLPKDPKMIKKLIKAKLKHVFETVAQKLNNTPAMAKGSYVDPSIINNWLDKLGITPQMVDSTMPYKEPIEEDREITFDGDAPVYKLPNWWDNDDIELVAKA